MGREVFCCVVVRGMWVVGVRIRFADVCVLFWASGAARVTNPSALVLIALLY